MNKNELFSAFGELDDGVLERSEAPAPRRKAPRLWKWGALAACIALAVGLAGGAFAAEAREYRAAVEFFQDNGLPMDGLNRAEVKAVYRDITTQRFTYDKTAEVLENWVPGLEIGPWESTPEELAQLWDRNVWYNAQPGAGIGYHVYCQYRHDGELGLSVLEKSLLECCLDGKPLWTAEFPDAAIDGYVHTSAGTAVWTHTYRQSSEQPFRAQVARVDESGNLLWQRQLEHYSMTDERVFQILDNGDGTWAVFSVADQMYFHLSQFDMDGNETGWYQIAVGQLGFGGAARLGDGYLVRLNDGESESFVRVDREGNRLYSSTYEGEDCDYLIADMVEFGGRFYLSAYAVPKQTNEWGSRSELADILDYVFSRDSLEIPSEELTPLVRDNYTAVLLLCDSEGGAPETFYSVKGSLGGKLAVNGAGELVWDVESVTDAFYSPLTSSFTIGGSCQVFRYTFDAAGRLLRQEDTGETVPYRR